jgi:hypothetical protein
VSAEYDLKPYRVEWQRFRTSTWVLAGDGGYDSHEDACACAREWVKAYGGFTRVIVQHVIQRVPS